MAAKIGKSDSYVLSNRFSYLDDATTTQTLDNILAPDAQARFKPVAQGSTSTNFGATYSAIWLTIELQTEAAVPARWMPEVDTEPMDRLDVYLSRTEIGPYGA